MSDIAFHIALRLADGEVVEDTFGGEPVQVSLDAGGEDVTGALEPFIVALVRDLEVAEEREVELDAEDAFGAPSDEHCHQLPITAFSGDLTVEPGHVVEFEMNGTPVAGTITELTDSSVTVDFNHPLAGRMSTYAYCEWPEYLFVALVNVAGRTRRRAWRKVNARPARPLA